MAQRILESLRRCWKPGEREPPLYTSFPFPMSPEARRPKGTYTKAMSKKRQIDLKLNYISKKQKELDEQMETLKKNRTACEDSSESQASFEDDSDLEVGVETTTGVSYFSPFFIY